jgi:hypothetical protein
MIGPALRCLNLLNEDGVFGTDPLKLLSILGLSFQLGEERRYRSRAPFKFLPPHRAASFVTAIVKVVFLHIVPKKYLFAEYTFIRE